MTKDISTIRGTIEFLKKHGQILSVKEQVDPIYEISGIEKALEGGPPLLFENIKGYPGVRNLGNIGANMETLAAIFDVVDSKKVKFKCLDAMKNQIPPQMVENPPCQEVVITDNIDVMGMLPILKHTERDGARILGGGNTLVCGKYFGGGTHISFNRMIFRGKDFSTIGTGLTHHFEEISWVHRADRRIPLTINITTPPAVMMVAAAGFVHTLVPSGTDELAIAGGLQGSPVRVCKAKTVDALAIADAEWVLEGYLDIDQKLWETDEAEKLGQEGVTPAFPEWHGAMGRASRTRKVQITAITHRKERPIFFTPLAASYENDNLGRPFREACFYELAERIAPGLVVDVNGLYGMRAWGAGIIYQINKSSRRYEGFERQIMVNALSSTSALQFVIAVDEDIDIYNADDILFAITTRVNPDRDIMKVGGWRAYGMMPAQRGEGTVTGVSGGEGKMATNSALAIDATAPFSDKWVYERAKYPVDKVDLSKWFSAEELARVKSMQSEYAALLARIGG